MVKSFQSVKRRSSSEEVTTTFNQQEGAFCGVCNSSENACVDETATGSTCLLACEEAVEQNGMIKIVIDFRPTYPVHISFSAFSFPSCIKEYHLFSALTGRDLEEDGRLTVLECLVNSVEALAVELHNIIHLEVGNVAVG